MKHSRYVLATALGLVLLGAAFLHSLRTNPDWQNFNAQLFLDSLWHLDWRWLTLAIGAVYGTYFLRALRWKVLLRPLKPDASLTRLLSATIIGFGAIGVMGRAGEIVRPYLIARGESVPLSSQLAVWVLERAFDLLILLATIGFAIGSLQGLRLEMQEWMQRAGFILGAATISLLVLLVVLRGYYDSIAATLLDQLGFLSPPRLRRVAHSLSVFGQGLHSMRDAPSVLLCIILSCILWLAIAVAYYAILAATPGGPHLTLIQTLLFMGIVLAGSMVQVPGIGGGMQITSILALTEIFGINVAIASGIAVLLWMLTFLVVLPPALVLVAWNGMTLSKLRQLESEAQAGGS